MLRIFINNQAKSIIGVVSRFLKSPSHWYFWRNVFSFYIWLKFKYLCTSLLDVFNYSLSNVSLNLLLRFNGHAVVQTFRIFTLLMDPKESLELKNWIIMQLYSFLFNLFSYHTIKGSKFFYYFKMKWKSIRRLEFIYIFYNQIYYKRV